MSQIKLVVYSVPFSLKELFKKAEVSEEVRFIEKKLKQFTNNGTLPEYWITDTNFRTWVIHMRQGNVMIPQTSGHKNELVAMVSELPDGVITVDKAHKRLVANVLNKAGHHVDVTTIQLPKKPKQ